MLRVCYLLCRLCAPVIRYTAGIVWFNEQRDEWLQMRRTTMKVAPVSMTIDVHNRRRTDNEVSLQQDEQQQLQQLQQQQQQLLLVDDTATDTPVTAPTRATIPAS